MLFTIDCQNTTSTSALLVAAPGGGLVSTTEHPAPHSLSADARAAAGVS